METNANIPKDRYNLVYGTVFLLGITSLLPWNFFINANDYWMYKFRDMNDTKYAVDPEYKSDLQTSFTSYLVIASKVPFVLFLLVNTYLSSRISPVIRVAVPLIICFALFCLTAGMVYVDTDFHQTAFLGITLTVVALINVVAAFLQGAGMGISGALPENYMKSNVYGQAAGGIFASVVQILTLVGDTSAQASALAYFLCAVATLAATFGAFIYMKNTSFYKYYMSTQVGNYGNIDTPTNSDQNIKGSNNVSPNEQEIRNRVPLTALIKQIWVYELTAIVVFWVTLTVFPAVVVLINSVNKDSPIAGRKFSPIACFLPFNIFDIVGRIMAAYIPLPRSKPKLLLFLAIARVIFIPMIMLCNAQPRYLTPVVFDNDLCYVLVIILFAITNGYLFSIAMSTGPKAVESQYQEIAGSIMAFCLGLGLMLGSVTSYGVVKLL